MKNKLAIFGGDKAIRTPLKGRLNIGEEEKNSVIRLFDKSIKTGNCFGYNEEEEECFREEFTAFMGGGCADAVSSGTAAVYVALRVLDPEPFSEIIVGAINDPGGMMPIVLMGCIPVPADTVPDSYNTGPSQIEERITPRTSAIVVPHLQGEPADMVGICKLAEKYKIPVVEDCAQAHYCKLHGRLVGTYGETAGFSTMFGKHINSGGQGGVVYSKNRSRYWDILRYADRGKPFGLPEGSFNCYASHNFNSNELACAIARVQLKKLIPLVEKRVILVQKFIQGLKDMEIDCLVPPKILEGAEPSYWYLRLKFDKECVTCSKKEFLEAAMAEGVLMISDYHKGLPSTFDWYTKKKVFGKNGFPWHNPFYHGNPNSVYEIPNAMNTVASHFNLCVFESWGDEEVELILSAFKKVYDAYRK